MDGNALDCYITAMLPPFCIPSASGPLSADILVKFHDRPPDGAVGPSVTLGALGRRFELHVRAREGRIFAHGK